MRGQHASAGIQRMTAPDRPYIPFDRAAGFYEATRHIPPECLMEAARLIRAGTRLRRSDPFLDAGTGTGRFARHLAGLGVGVVGVDAVLAFSPALSFLSLPHAASASPRASRITRDMRFAIGSFPPRANRSPLRVPSVAARRRRFKARGPRRRQL